MAITEDNQSTLSTFHNSSDDKSDVDDSDSSNEPKGPPQACLFVASLSTETREEQLYEFFGQFGQVLKIKMLKDRSSRPYAFVQYQTVEESDVALEQTNGSIFDNRRLRVEKAKVNRTLFIAKLAKDMNNNQLREYVEVYGPVESVTIIKNHKTNTSKGCGFVKFYYREDAIEAFVGLKNKHKKWVVEWATSTNDPDLLGIDKCNIFIGGLNPAKIDRELLSQRFSFYGEIESITLINRGDCSSPTSKEDPVTQRSAFAFVRYKDLSNSASAIENENGVEWLDRRIRVQYCESQEMKTKRRLNKYYQDHLNIPYFYPGMPMMMFNSMPMYNPPIPSSKYNPGYIPENPEGNDSYSNSVPYPLPMYMYSDPWLYNSQLSRMENYSGLPMFDMQYPADGESPRFFPQPDDQGNEEDNQLYVSGNNYNE